MKNLHIKYIRQRPYMMFLTLNKQISQMLALNYIINCFQSM